MTLLGEISRGMQIFRKISRDPLENSVILKDLHLVFEG
jgi:hypothetical protein